MGWRPGCAGRWRCMSGCSNGKGMLQKDFIASGTSGVHLVLSTSARSKRNNPPAAEHLSRTCVHLDVPEAYVLFFVTSPHIYSRTRVLLHHEFHDLQHPLLKERETGFEPATLALARRYSTTEPLAHMKLEQILKPESARRDSNPRPSPWQGDTPPLSHSRIFHVRSREHLRLYYGTVCLSILF